MDISRAQRVSDQVRRELGRLLLQEAKDPRINRVSLTGCEVSRDLSHAKIFYMIADQEYDLEKTQLALDKAAGFFRSRLAEELSLRKTPKLRFFYDASIDEGRRMSSLIEEAIGKDQANPNYQAEDEN